MPYPKQMLPPSTPPRIDCKLLKEDSRDPGTDEDEKDDDDNKKNEIDT